MSDREDGHSERARFWLDIEWVEPPSADDDSSAVQAFIDKLSQTFRSQPLRFAMSIDEARADG